MSGHRKREMLETGRPEAGLTRRSLLCATGITLAIGVLPPLRAQASEPAGLVVDVKGESYAESGNARRALERNSPIFEADLVITGAASRLMINLGEQTGLWLGEEVRINIDRNLVDTGGEFRLETGAMLFDQTSTKPASVQIHSPYGLVAGRGTRFFAGPSKGVFGVFVQRGAVSVTAAGREVALLMGQGTDIAYPGDKPITARRWGDQRIREALESVL